MTLAIFDLDNTLIAGDSDHAWGEFLIDEGLVEAEQMRRENDRFYQDYLAGTLNIERYLQFALAFLAAREMAELDALHQTFMARKIHPIMLPRASDLLDHHRQQGHRLMIITATNHFVTAPIARKLGVDDLIASDAEIRDGRYTGQPSGVPSYQAGKVKRLHDWLEHNDESLKGAWFYSDSHNDLPLLKEVDYPVAVDPDSQLRSVAEEKGWPVISLRD